MGAEFEGARDDQFFERRQRPLHRLIFWARSLIVREVPPEMAACEYGCKVGTCRNADWLDCVNRLRQLDR